MPSRSPARSEAGNVLFLILIAVALFAALSYAVTQSTRSGGGNADGEKRSVDSAVIVQYPTSVQAAIQRQMLSNNISADNLLFDAPSTYGAMTPDQLARQVFSPTGGGAIYQTGWWFGSCDGVRQVGRSGSGANINLDIIAYLPIPNIELCRTINTKLGITSALPQMYTTYQYLPEMTLAYPGICNGAAGGEITQAEFVGKTEGCYQDGDWGYLYYHVLLQR